MTSAECSGAMNLQRPRDPEAVRAQIRKMAGDAVMQDTCC